jgi:hypothetical protein
VLNCEFEPLAELLLDLRPPAPPAPTVIGKAVAVTVTLFGELG